MDSKLYNSLLRGKKSIPEFANTQLEEVTYHRLTIVQPATDKDKDVKDFKKKVAQREEAKFSNKPLTQKINIKKR